MKRVPPKVSSALLAAGYNLKDFEHMTPKDLFDAYCTWHGLINWGYDLWEVMESLQRGDTDR